jgi:hypothetical protein
MQKEKTPRLSRDENVARGYAVYTPHGTYRNPIPGKLRGYVDSGHLKVDEWGRPYITDQFDADIKAITKPELQSLSSGDTFTRMLESLEIDEIETLSTKITTSYDKDALFYFLEDKPAELVAMEAELQNRIDAYWTPERKAIQSANNKAQNTYDVSVVRIENARRDVEKILEKNQEIIDNAIARKNNPALAASQDKISAIITDKKRSSLQRLEAIQEGQKSAGAAFNAKREIVLAIAAFLGKGLDKDTIETHISKMDTFSALAYKNEKKEFNRLFKDTTSWIHHKNQIKLWWDLVGWIAEGMKNSKIRTKTKDQFYLIMVMVALHQAKDNDSRGLVAFRYLTRTTVVSQKSLSLDPRGLGEKFTAYEKFGYISYEKGVQGGVASRAGIKPYTGTLTVEDAKAAIEAIMNIFSESPFQAELDLVLSLVTRTTVVSQKTLTPPAYDDQDLENAVDDLLAVFVPISRSAADERIAERQIESVDFEAAKETYLAEQAERINKHLESGVGFQPRQWYSQSPQIHAEALV